VAGIITVRQVWAVVRGDSSSVLPESVPDLANQVVVKEVLLDEGLAAAEVARLNALNREKGAYYFYQVTRLKDGETNVVSPPNPE